MGVRQQAVIWARRLAALQELYSSGKMDLDTFYAKVTQVWALAREARVTDVVEGLFKNFVASGAPGPGAPSTRTVRGHPQP
jgi:hypothetical protein